MHRLWPSAAIVAFVTVVGAVGPASTTLAGNPAWKEPSWEDTHFSDGCARQLASFCDALMRRSPRVFVTQKCIRPEYASPQCRALLIERGLAR